MFQVYTTYTVVGVNGRLLFLCKCTLSSEVVFIHNDILTDSLNVETYQISDLEEKRCLEISYFRNDKQKWMFQVSKHMGFYETSKHENSSQKQIQNRHVWRANLKLHWSFLKGVIKQKLFCQMESLIPWHWSHMTKIQAQLKTDDPNIITNLVFTRVWSWIVIPEGSYEAVNIFLYQVSGVLTQYDPIKSDIHQSFM